MRTTLPKRQQGMTFIGWLLVLGIAGMFAVVGLALAPIYLEHFSIKEVLLSFEHEPQLDKKDNHKIRQLMKRRLKINGVYDFDVRNNVRIKRSGTLTTIRVAYEVRKPVVGNVDVVVHFDDSVTH
jgi:hypothetical protein